MDDQVKKQINKAKQALLHNSQSDYIGEAISQLEHVIECGHFAKESNHSDEVIVASLFHDIGHYAENLPRPKMGNLGVLHHEWVGGKILRELGFNRKVCSLVRYHVEAKRYLSGKKNRYYENLSDASKGTLSFQGGPMSIDEIKSFENHPWFREIIQVRVNDEKSKLQDFHLPSIDSFDKHLINCLDSSLLELKSRTAFYIMGIEDYTNFNYQVLEEKLSSVINANDIDIILISSEAFKYIDCSNKVYHGLQEVTYIEPLLDTEINYYDKLIIDGLITNALNSMLSSYVFITDQRNGIYLNQYLLDKKINNLHIELLILQ
ncbi:HD domain-containing protein [Thiotrichales bacterium 19S11-10]|nr:HD domain-containing protein [Thiotrichales bacterium 19S11-10]